MEPDSEIAPQFETGDYAAGWMALRWYQAIHFVVMFGGALIGLLVVLAKRADPFSVFLVWLAVSTVASRPMGNRPMKPGMGDMVRGTAVTVHPRQKRIVVNERGVRRSVDLMPNYQAQHRTASGNATIDLSTLQRDDQVELAMRGDQARMVTLMPGRHPRMR